MASCVQYQVPGVRAALLATEFAAQSKISPLVLRPPIADEFCPFILCKVGLERNAPRAGCTPRMGLNLTDSAQSILRTKQKKANE